MSKRSPLHVDFTPAAQTDLEVAFAFVNEQNRAAARDLLDRMEAAVGRLSRFPEMGAPLSDDEFEFVAPGIRFVVVEPYVLFYRASDQRVVVTRVLHSRQDSLGALFE